MSLFSFAGNEDVGSRRTSDKITVERNDGPAKYSGGIWHALSNFVGRVFLAYFCYRTIDIKVLIFCNLQIEMISLANSRV